MVQMEKQNGLKTYKLPKMDLVDYLKQNPKKHLVFDFDGTIYRLNWEAEESVNDYRNRFWATIRDLDAELIKEMPSPVPGKTEYIVNNAIKKHGDKAKEILFKLLESKEQTLIGSERPIEPIIDFIKKYNTDFTFHVWSSNMSSTVETTLKNNSLLQYFDLIICRDNVNQSKPDPEGFRLIYDKSLPKSDYLMIGDADRDRGAAENAGIDFFLVS